MSERLSAKLFVDENDSSMFIAVAPEADMSEIHGEELLSKCHGAPIHFSIGNIDDKDKFMLTVHCSDCGAPFEITKELAVKAGWQDLSC